MFLSLSLSISFSFASLQLESLKICLNNLCSCVLHFLVHYLKPISIFIRPKIETNPNHNRFYFIVLISFWFLSLFQFDINLLTLLGIFLLASDAANWMKLQAYWNLMILLLDGNMKRSLYEKCAIRFWFECYRAVYFKSIIVWNSIQICMNGSGHFELYITQNWLQSIE